MITFCFVPFQLTFSNCNRSRTHDLFAVYACDRTIRSGSCLTILVWFDFSIVSFNLQLARHTTLNEKWFKGLLALITPLYST